MKSNVEFVMRRFLIPLLLASVLTPVAALAQDRELGRGDRPRGERSSQSDSSPNDRPQRAARAERSSGNDSAVRVEHAERPIRVEPNEPVVRSQGVDQPVRIRRAERPAEIERVERIGRSAPASQTIESAEQAQNVPPTGNNIVDALRAQVREQQLRRDGSHDGDQDGDHHWDVNRDGKHRWSGEWRHDHRYDWRGHRSRYSSLYRFGRYYDPYGWGYRRFSIGLNLWPSYYGSSFWLNDPWQYRLPPAYGPYRWVRYYDDALLVNIYTGQVVDVVHNFFW